MTRILHSSSAKFLTVWIVMNDIPCSRRGRTAVPAVTRGADTVQGSHIRTLRTAGRAGTTQQSPGDAHTLSRETAVSAAGHGALGTRVDEHRGDGICRASLPGASDWPLFHTVQTTVCSCSPRMTTESDTHHQRELTVMPDHRQGITHGNTLNSETITEQLYPVANAFR